MSRIIVTAKIDGGIHLKYGEIKKRQKYEIEDIDFSEQLFERPPGFESPLEKADRERAAELKQSVGAHEYKAPPEAQQIVPAPEKAKKGAVDAESKEG